MNRSDLRAAVLLLVLALLTTWAADSWAPDHRLADSRPPGTLADQVPRQFGVWTLDPSQAVVQPAPDLQANLDAIYSDLLGRTYVDSAGRRMMLSVAYVASAARGATVHRPEVCYLAQGFSVHALQQGSISLAEQRIPVVRASMRRQSRHEPVTYWIIVGTTAVAGSWSARWAQLRYTMRGTLPDALLVRVSSIDNDSPRAFVDQERFVKDLAGSLPVPTRLRLFGDMPGTTGWALQADDRLTRPVQARSP